MGYTSLVIDEARRKFETEAGIIRKYLLIIFPIFGALVIMGNLRPRKGRRTRNISFFLFSLTAAYISFVTGQMSTSARSNDLYLLWISFTVYLDSVANKYSCISLEDNEGAKKRIIIDYLVIWPLIFGFLYKTLVSPVVIVPVVLVLLLVLLRFRERSYALTYATNSFKGLCRASKIISYFNMYKEDHGGEIISNYSDPLYNNLLVGVKEARIMVVKQSKKRLRFMDFDLSKVVTLDRVLDTDNAMFWVFANTMAGKELQNTCISFSMFWVLLAKMVGYDNVDVKLLKGKTPLPDNSFALVETEISFLYEYLFTNCYAKYDRGLWRKLRDFCLIVLFFIVTLPLLIQYRYADENIDNVSIAGRALDAGITRFVILCIISMELIEIGVFLTSKWAKVMYTCTYLTIPTQKSTIRNLILFIIKIVCLVAWPRHLIGKHRSRKIRQYSILERYNNQESKPILQMVMLFTKGLGATGMPYGGYTITNNLSLELEKSILKAINNCVDQREGKLSNGVSSLKDNGVEEYVIKTFLKSVSSQARVVLIWHVTTRLFEVARPKKSNNTKSSKTEDDIDFEIANVISKYSAYLGGFIPQSLSDNIYKVHCEYDEAVKELQRESRDYDEDNKDPKGGLNGENSILEEARELKERLSEYPNLWKILAEFWTETLLFIAISDHDEAINMHINYLCLGKEFITHVWALATHAGCSRAPTEISMANVSESNDNM